MSEGKKYITHVFDTDAELFESVAVTIIESANKAIAEKGKFSLVLSGGQTPEALYRLLMTEPYRTDMPWQHIHFFFGDERCVPLDDDRNNAHRAIITLLDHVPVDRKNIHRIPTDLSPADAATAYQQTIDHYFGTRAHRFDLVLLGMGDNGHTASLFPGTDVLKEDRAIIRSVFVPEENMHRITMTAPLINKAHEVFILVTGKKKAAMLKDVLQTYEQKKYPVQLIDPIEGRTLWFVDKEANNVI